MGGRGEDGRLIEGWSRDLHGVGPRVEQARDTFVHRCNRDADRQTAISPKGIARRRSDLLHLERSGVSARRWLGTEDERTGCAGQVETPPSPKSMGHRQDGTDDPSSTALGSDPQDSEGTGPLESRDASSSGTGWLGGDAAGLLDVGKWDWAFCRVRPEGHDRTTDNPCEPVAAGIGDVGWRRGERDPGPGTGLHGRVEDMEAGRTRVEEQGDGRRIPTRTSTTGRAPSEVPCP